MLSVIIPAHNEEKSVVSVIRGVKRTLNQKGLSYELIVVNDGSTDNTKALTEKEDVILVSHQKCRGYGRALKTGIEKARGEFVLTIDADNQNSPEDILKLVEHIEQYDIVIGARTNTTSLARAFAKKFLFAFANYLAEYKIPDLNSGFRVIKKDIALKYFYLLPDSSSFSSTITFACLKDGYNVKFVSIEEKPREFGKSGIRPFKDFLRFFMLILRLGALLNPLRVFLPISFFMFLAGALWALFDIITALNITASPVLLIVGSIIIFLLGLIADQIAYLRRKIHKS